MKGSEKMKKIESFKVDHNKLKRGVYLSRVDDNIKTLDLRFREPNVPPFLENAVMHSIEHLFATIARNSEFSKNIVYFGPMGCRTGFYFLIKDMSNKDALNLTKNIILKISEYNGELPGNTAIECGNYKEHNLDGAIEEAKSYYEIIKNWSEM